MKREEACEGDIACFYAEKNFLKVKQAFAIDKVCFSFVKLIFRQYMYTVVFNCTLNCMQPYLYASLSTFFMAVITVLCLGSCAIQQVLVDCLFHFCSCVCSSPILQCIPGFHCSFLVRMSLFPISVCFIWETYFISFNFQFLPISHSIECLSFYELHNFI